MSAYDHSEEDNIESLAKSLNAIQYQRLCRLIRISKDYIDYSFQGKLHVLSLIQEKFNRRDNVINEQK